MGYTHHWYRQPVLNAKKFINFALDCMKAKVAWQTDTIGQQITNVELRPMHLKGEIWRQDVIEFSGGCERFLMEQRFSGTHRPPKEDGTYFSFCKTDKLPYDTLVTACLLIAKHHFGKAIKVSSNGDIEDWAAGIALVEKVVSWKSTWRFDEQIVDGLSDKSLEETKKTKKEIASAQS